MTHHSDLLNFLMVIKGLSSYLEIGVCNRNHNFNKIITPYKTCVDPDPNAGADFQCTSDFFFGTLNKLLPDDGGGQTFDLIFIDGLHYADQVRRDIQNAFDILNAGGYVVVHDSNPSIERITRVPRDSREWTGDVYKTICQIESPKITLDFDYGCCVIWKNDGLEWNDLQVSWEEFNERRRELLNLVSIHQGLKIINGHSLHG